MIWLKHDIHGVKQCYVESEALTDEKNGWVRFEPKFVSPIVEKEVTLLDDIEQLDDAPKKRGRPFKVE